MLPGQGDPSDLQHHPVLVKGQGNRSLPSGGLWNSYHDTPAHHECPTPVLWTTSYCTNLGQETQNSTKEAPRCEHRLWVRVDTAQAGSGAGHRWQWHCTLQYPPRKTYMKNIWEQIFNTKICICFLILEHSEKEWNVMPKKGGNPPNPVELGNT